MTRILGAAVLAGVLIGSAAAAAIAAIPRGGRPTGAGDVTGRVVSRPHKGPVQIQAETGYPCNPGQPCATLDQTPPAELWQLCLAGVPVEGTISCVDVDQATWEDHPLGSYYTTSTR